MCSRWKKLKKDNEQKKKRVNGNNIDISMCQIPIPFFLIHCLLQFASFHFSELEEFFSIDFQIKEKKTENKEKEWEKNQHTNSNQMCRNHFSLIDCIEIPLLAKTNE